MNKLVSVLAKYKEDFHSVVSFNLNNEKVLVLDLTENNGDLHQIDMSDTSVLSEYIFGEMNKKGVLVAIGGYAENRFIYQRSAHFSGEEPRSIHLGVDIWAVAKTPIFAPLQARVHSFANNSTFGDYGYTIILEHNLDNLTFFTLYGHLAKSSFEGIYNNKEIKKGENFAWLGDMNENGNWPPHLHFQIIGDLMQKAGDFPGVAAPSKKEFYLANSPNPNLILQSRFL